MTSLLPRVLRGAGDSPEAVEQCVFAAWVSVVGRQVARVTAPLRLHQKRLSVAVLDDGWRRQLKAISGQITFKINAALGAAEVRAVDLAIDRAKVHAAHPDPGRVTFSATLEHTLPLQENADLIPDPVLRDAFLRVAGKCLERNAARYPKFTDGATTHDPGR